MRELATVSYTRAGWLAGCWLTGNPTVAAAANAAVVAATATEHAGWVVDLERVRLALCPHVRAAQANSHFASAWLCFHLADTKFITNVTISLWLLFTCPISPPVTTSNSCKIILHLHPELGCAQSCMTNIYNMLKVTSCKKSNIVLSN